MAIIFKHMKDVQIRNHKYPIELYKIYITCHIYNIIPAGYRIYRTENEEKADVLDNFMAVIYNFPISRSKDPYNPYSLGYQISSEDIFKEFGTRISFNIGSYEEIYMGNDMGDMVPIYKTQILDMARIPNKSITFADQEELLDNVFDNKNTADWAVNLFSEINDLKVPLRQGGFLFNYKKDYSNNNVQYHITDLKLSNNMRTIIATGTLSIDEIPDDEDEIKRIIKELNGEQNYFKIKIEGDINKEEANLLDWNYDIKDVTLKMPSCIIAYDPKIDLKIGDHNAYIIDSHNRDLDYMLTRAIQYIEKSFK